MQIGIRGVLYNIAWYNQTGGVRCFTPHIRHRMNINFRIWQEIKLNLICIICFYILGQWDDTYREAGRRYHTSCSSQSLRSTQQEFHRLSLSSSVKAKEQCRVNDKGLNEVLAPAGNWPWSGGMKSIYCMMDRMKWHLACPWARHRSVDSDNGMPSLFEPTVVIYCTVIHCMCNWGDKIPQIPQEINFVLNDLFTGQIQ